MVENLRHWSALSKTDPKHTKPFQRAGGFKGTAIKPIWSMQRMTEHFGPCGTGWGMEKPEFTVQPVGDEILVYCTVCLWYREQPIPEGADPFDARNMEARVFGVGGDKVAVKRKDGRVDADDEAFKKAYTDALSNAMKQLGVGADVHMGMFEDSKYLREVEKEFAEENGNGHAKPDVPAETPEAANAKKMALVVKSGIDAATKPNDTALGLKVAGTGKDREDIATIRKHLGDGWADRLHELAAHKIVELSQRMGQ